MAAELGQSTTVVRRFASSQPEATFRHRVVGVGLLDPRHEKAGIVVSLSLETFDSFTALAPYQQRWDQLAGGVVFRSFDWCRLWWEHYGQRDSGCQLHVVVARRTDPAGQECVAIAPWMIVRTIARGTVIRWLGSGEVCSDHLSLLVQPGDEQALAGALVGHLAADAPPWDLLQLEAIDQGDPAMAALTAALTEQGCATRQQQSANCWAIELPANWDDFLAMQSKSHRKQLRQAYDRVVATPRVKWHQATNPDELEAGWEIFVDLHQRRRQSLGEPGCFASPKFEQFHRQLAHVLLSQGRLRLSWLELDGKPAAAEYHFADGLTTSAYQGGVDPQRLAEEPGRLSNIVTLRQAISEGHQRFDLLRGDEPYKAHWRATPHATYRLESVAPHTFSRWRAQSYDWAIRMADKMRAGAKRRGDAALSHPQGMENPL